MIPAPPLGVLLASALLLTGCSDDGGDPEGSPSDTSSGAEWHPTPGLCRILTADERAGLLAIDDPKRLAGQPLQERGCAWVDRKNPAVQLVLVTLPTWEWFRDLPGALEAQLASPDLDAAQRADLETIQDEVESADAEEVDGLCGLFSRLAEVQGYPEGSTTTVYLTRGAPGLSAQSCEEDTFTSLVGRSNRIGDSPEMLDAYQAALEKVVDAR